MVILQDIYNLCISRDLLFRLVFRGVAVVLQLIFFTVNSSLNAKS